MATIRERLIYAVELVTDKANQSVRGFRSSLAEAEGGFNKFKAGASAAMASVAANAGTLGLAGGAALVAFSAKVVGAAQDTALAAGKLHDATGIALEDGSRLLEVASDLGVSGDTVTAIVKKMNVEIGKGSPAIGEIGIELKKTADGADDVNATLLDTFKRIGAIENPAKRAAAAQAIFGRGYAEAAELIFTNADQLQQKLAAVSKEKIVTDEELARAREFRDNLKNLQDVSEDLAVAAGQVLVPVLSQVADELVGLSEGARDAGDAIGKIPGVPEFLKSARFLGPIGAQILIYEKLADGVRSLNDRWNGSVAQSDRFNDSVLAGGDAAASAKGDVAELAGAADDVGEAAGSAAHEVTALEQATRDGGDAWGGYLGAVAGATSAVGGAHGDFRQMQEDLEAINEQARSDAMGVLADAIGAVGEAIDDAFSDVRDNLDLQDLLDDITEQFGKVAEAQNVMTENGEQGVRDYNREVRDLRRQLLELVDSIDNIPPQKKVEIIAAIQRGSIDELYGILGDLAKGVVVPVSFSAQPIQAFKDLNAIFSGQSAPTAPTFSQPNPAPTDVGGIVDNRQITIINPIGSTPTTQYIDQQTDYRRNGYR